MPAVLLQERRCGRNKRILRFFVRAVSMQDDLLFPETVQGKPRRKDRSGRIQGNIRKALVKELFNYDQVEERCARRKDRRRKDGGEPAPERHLPVQETVLFPGEYQRRCRKERCKADRGDPLHRRSLADRHAVDKITHQGKAVHRAVIVDGAHDVGILRLLRHIPGIDIVHVEPGCIAIDHEGVLLTRHQVHVHRDREVPRHHALKERCVLRRKALRLCGIGLQVIKPALDRTGFVECRDVERDLL